MIKVGVIGAGRIAIDGHIPAVLKSPRAKLVGICVQDINKHKDQEKQYLCPWYSDHKKFITEVPMDLVIICAPAYLHASMASLCAKAGRHVLVEKPLSINLAEALAVIDDCRRAGVMLGVCYQRRLSPVLLQLKHMLDSGELGQIISVTTETIWHRPHGYYHDGKGTFSVDGGGALINQGIHSIDMLHFLFGPAQMVFCETQRRFHNLEAEDLAMGLVKLPQNIVASFVCTTAAGVNEDYKLTVVGTRATAKLCGTKLCVISGDPHDIKEHDQIVYSSNITLQELVRQQFEQMLDAVLGIGRPACTGEEAIMSLTTVIAAYESAKKGCWVKINDAI